MQYTTLGRTGVQVSRLCFGTMSFGGDADEHVSADMFKGCRDAGINFFDCANVYAEGRSEVILGKLIADCRDDLVITSKCVMPTGKGPNQRGASRHHMFQAVEQSLKRLNTDRLDLYFLHHYDPHTPIEQMLTALDDLVRQGKILYPAVSNWSAWQIAKSLGISQFSRLARFECIQPMYNLVKRQAEVEILPLAESENMAVVSYSPLGGGLLSGKYTTKTRPKAGRIVENKMYSSRYGDESNYQVAERFSAYAQQHDTHPATLAVAWVMAHDAVTAPIIGARNPDQLAPSLAALDYEMSPEQYRQISALSIDPPLATDRAEEQ